MPSYFRHNLQLIYITKQLQRAAFRSLSQMPINNFTFEAYTVSRHNLRLQELQFTTILTSPLSPPSSVHHLPNLKTNYHAPQPAPHTPPEQ